MSAGILLTHWLSTEIDSYGTGDEWPQCLINNSAGGIQSSEQ